MDGELLTLTDRELNILRQIALGQKSKDIAIRLGVSVRTVEAHRASIMRKLNLHSTGLLIRFAIHHKIVDV
jgi:two-component system response regulator NreC